MRAEAARLERTPRDLEARLEHLERLFGGLQPRDFVKLTPAAYSSVGRFLQDDLRGDPARETGPAEEAAKARADCAGRPAGLAGLTPTDLVMGRDYLPLDESLLPSKPAKPEYLSAAAAPSGMFVRPGGATERRPLEQMPAFQSFWLDAPAAN
uniref:Uncharacterized protein n=1 Tax=Alexandrium andersonii TaxID=327968 RepID=A0A7S2CD97_9DINO